MTTGATVWAIYYQHFAQDSNHLRQLEYRKRSARAALAMIFLHLYRAHHDPFYSPEADIDEFKSHEVSFANMVRAFSRFLEDEIPNLRERNWIQFLADILAPRAIESPCQWMAEVHTAGDDVEKVRQYYRLTNHRLDLWSNLQRMSKTKMMALEALDLAY